MNDSPDEPEPPEWYAQIEEALDEPDIPDPVAVAIRKILDGWCKPDDYPDDYETLADIHEYDNEIRLNKSAGVSDGPGISKPMDQKLIQALIFTLVDAYGNDNVYHPDGTKYDMESLLSTYLRTDPPKGEALAWQDLESQMNNTAYEFTYTLGVTDAELAEIGEAYTRFITLARGAVLRKFPTTKFANF